MLVSFGLCKIFAGLYLNPCADSTHESDWHGGHQSRRYTAGWCDLGGGIVQRSVLVVMGLTGAVSWIAKITSRPVVLGLIMGLGLAFIHEGVKMMGANPLLAISAAVLTFILLSHERIPAMLVLLGVGALIALVAEPTLLSELGRLSFHFRVPAVTLTKLSQSELMTGILVLGLP